MLHILQESMVWQAFIDPSFVLILDVSVLLPLMGEGSYFGNAKRNRLADGVKSLPVASKPL